MDSAAASLGSVDIDVGANLERLLRGFRDAELAADRFDAALTRRVSQSAANAQRATAALGAAEGRLGQSFDRAGNSANRFARDVERAGASSAVAARQVDNSAAAIRRTLLASASVITAAFGLNELKNLADGYTRFTNQLKVAGVASGDLAGKQEAIFQVAQKYGVQLEAIGTLYGRVTLAGKELGASQKDVMRFTNGVAAALKIQGGAASETRGAMLQLSQLLGAPMVQAQEFNSILDGARPIIQAVANGIDKYGGSIAKLRADIIAGNVTSKEFFQGFLAGSSKLESQATQANLTIGASFTTLFNALGKYIGETDKSLGATNAISAGIKALAGNLNVIMPILAAIAIAIGTRYVAAAGRMVASSTLVQAALFAIQARAAGAATTMEALAFAGATAGRTLLAAFGGPLGVAILAIAGAVYYFYQRQEAANAEIKAFNDHGTEATKILREEATRAGTAAAAVKALGKDHQTATGYVTAFAGATGDAADALHRQAEEAKNARLALIDLAIQHAKDDKAAADKTEAESRQSGGSVARFGYQPESATHADAVRRSNAAQERLTSLEAARRGVANESAEDRYKREHPNWATQGRDLNAEIVQKRQQLLVAQRNGNAELQRELLAEIKLRQRILELMKTGLTLENAEAQANAEKIKAPRKPSDTPQFTGSDADRALSGIGAHVTSNKRSRAEQQRLYERYQAYKAGTGPWAPVAAAPGTSAHETDRARDVRKTPGMTLGKIREAIEGAGGRITELLDEGDHFHVAWAKTMRSAEEVAQDRLHNEETFNSELARTNDDIAAAKQAQLTNEEDIAEAERARIRADAEADIAKTRTKMATGDYTEDQGAQLIKARTDLRDLQLAAVDTHEKQRLAADALKTAEAQHDRELEILQAQEDIATTASDRRDVERRILVAQREYERKVLQATIDSPYTKPLDRQLAQSSLAGLDKRYEGKIGAVNNQTRDNLLGTSSGTGKYAQQDEIEKLRKEGEDKLAIVQEALDARIILEEEAAARRVEIESETHDKILALETARKEVQIAAAQSTAESLANIAESTLGKQSAVYKAMFAVSKAFAIADSIIKIQQALASATASLPFPANLPVIAMVAAEGASIISSIMAVGATFEGGGYTGNMGRSTVAGVVHGQEFVSHAAATKKYRPILEDMNAGRDPTARLQAAANENGGGLGGGGGSRPLSVKLQNFAPGVSHIVKPGLTRDEVVIIAREEAPKAVAGELARPNSNVRKSLQQHTTTRGRKT
jgi:tape measure domain-containing protein